LPSPSVLLKLSPRWAPPLLPRACFVGVEKTASRRGGRAQLGPWFAALAFRTRRCEGGSGGERRIAAMNIEID
ncbi:hypothetical protein D2Q93_17230, partial [Alicyclobacillaceae bacterium I2511]